MGDSPWGRKEWDTTEGLHFLFSPLFGLAGGASGKESTSQCRRHRDVDSIPGSGRSPGGGHGNPFQYSCLEDPVDPGAWWATVHEVTKASHMTEHISPLSYLIIKEDTDETSVPKASLIFARGHFL